MKIAIITLHTPEIISYATIANVSKLEYARKYGYDYIVSDVSLDESRPASWSKILLAKHFLGEYDWILLIDADAFIMNPDTKLEDLIDENYNLVMCANEIRYCSIGVPNFGVVLLKNCEWSLKLLDDIYKKDEFTNHIWWEQAAFLECYKQKEISDKVKIIPQNKMNSFIWNYKEGDFILHFAGVPNRMHCINEFYQSTDKTNYISAIAKTI